MLAELINDEEDDDLSNKAFSVRNTNSRLLKAWEKWQVLSYSRRF